MANPKCGTCRFFQENDLPGSGWCHHPQRKVSSDVKILVRRSELACRDDWSRSLWQPATGEPGADSAPRPAPSDPLAPASPESLRAVLNRDLTVRAETGEDVLLSEGRIVSEDAEPWQPPARPFPSGNFDPRTAIFRAREAYREKNRASAVAARHAVAAGAFEHGRIDAVGDERSGDARRVEIGAAAAHRFHRAEVVENEAKAPSTTEAVLVAEPASSAGDDLVEAAEKTGSAFWDAEFVDADEPVEMTSPLRPDVCAPEFSRPSVDAAVAGEPRSALVPTGLPPWFRAELPRVCRTCRDFRPGTDGQRGWCANAWAFTHRQLVRDDDPAPCHSAIGDWWAPVDDVWLVAADVSTHGRPTPLLDRMTGSESGQRRRS